jgi:hypothetical protein
MKKFYENDIDTFEGVHKKKGSKPTAKYASEDKKRAVQQSRRLKYEEQRFALNV